MRLLSIAGRLGAWSVLCMVFVTHFGCTLAHPDSRPRPALPRSLARHPDGIADEVTVKAPPTVAVLRTETSTKNSFNAKRCDMLLASVRQVVPEVKEILPEALWDGGKAGTFEMIVVCGEECPPNIYGALKKYMKAGGIVVAIGGSCRQTGEKEMADLSGGRVSYGAAKTQRLKILLETPLTVGLEVDKWIKLKTEIDTTSTNNENGNVLAVGDLFRPETKLGAQPILVMKRHGEGACVKLIVFQPLGAEEATDKLFRNIFSRKTVRWLSSVKKTCEVPAGANQASVDQAKGNPLMNCKPAEMKSIVKKLCLDFMRQYGNNDTCLVYDERLDTPQGINVLSPPTEIAMEKVNGEYRPYGYGSGLSDTALCGGTFLYALCEAYEATGDKDFADMAKWAFKGMRLIGSVSPDPGFVPRGPHPDGKSYYKDSSLDQHSIYLMTLWRYYHSPLATPDDKRFIVDKAQNILKRLEKYNWEVRVEDGSKVAKAGDTWLNKDYSSCCVLLFSALAVGYDLTKEPHWLELYKKYGEEEKGVRWEVVRRGFDPTRLYTIYQNQDCMRFHALSKANPDPSKSQAICEGFKNAGERMLRENIFSPTGLRRNDWTWTTGFDKDAQDEEKLNKINMSLNEPLNSMQAWNKYDPEMLKKEWIHQALAVRLPAGIFQFCLFVDDEKLKREVLPYACDVTIRVDHDRISSGEHRVVLIGMALKALAVLQQCQDAVEK